MTKKLLKKFSPHRFPKSHVKFYLLFVPLFDTIVVCRLLLSRNS